jgi:hypothetical protein
MREAVVIHFTTTGNPPVLLSVPWLLPEQGWALTGEKIDKKHVAPNQQTDLRT